MKGEVENSSSLTGDEVGRDGIWVVDFGGVNELVVAASALSEAAQFDALLILHGCSLCSSARNDVIKLRSVYHCLFLRFK